MTKPVLTHDHEEKITQYCAKNLLKFNFATAFQYTMETFKDEPIMVTISEEGADGKESKKVDVTRAIARQIECNGNTIDRIAAKIDYAVETGKAAEYATNIKKSKLDDKPDLDLLVDGLYNLNIVTATDYLSLVCFLMQLKYTRDQEFEENDKTCVFFNGVARNGKSATAKAICDVESQYGTVFCAQSAKLLESTHEENVWKSHLNYFDEVKPTDVDRELLLRVINGGDVELNPKNYKPYSYNCNTNNIFTSNDQINLKQRRVSVIKFGDQISAAPLPSGTLKKIMTQIMNSLPSFDRYFEIYRKVMLANERRINPLAIEAIIAYLEHEIGHVCPEKEETMTLHKVFSASNIYSYVKDTYSKQIISSERKEAITQALKQLLELKYLLPRNYETSSTKFYTIYGSDFLKLKDFFNIQNTRDEHLKKVSKPDLRTALLPYFSPVVNNGLSAPIVLSPDFIEDKNNTQNELKTIAHDEFARLWNELELLKKEEDTTVHVSTPILKQAVRCFGKFKKEIEKIRTKTNLYESAATDAKLAALMEKVLTKGLCDSVHYDVLIDYFKECYHGKFTDECQKFLMKRYCSLTGCFDAHELKLKAETKAQEIPYMSDLKAISAGAYYCQKGHVDEHLEEEKESYARLEQKSNREAEEWALWYGTFLKALKGEEPEMVPQNKCECDDRVPF